MIKIHCEYCYYKRSDTASLYPCGCNICEIFESEKRKIDEIFDLGLFSEGEHVAAIARLKDEFEDYEF